MLLSIGFTNWNIIGKYLWMHRLCGYYAENDLLEFDSLSLSRSSFFLWKYQLFQVISYFSAVENREYHQQIK